ncbi:beta-galactosidase-1-like protein 2 isoform X2 [Scleropages formosus]|uniref:beta-galactosidase-1-like protein 2 isoform X2 n=1 Tax=Scleropages formosus TaxID=113540 RepID=UPI0010FAB4BE|nr:beta-galactosidase-1-like protein 2 isoform X2 [Scleropages formosus]
MEKSGMSRRCGLNADSSQFTLDGKPIRILGGSMHYFRVPRAYWNDRMLKMKACGLNTITTYVPWNLHEPERGVFNFRGQLDLLTFINEAAQVGLWVILRPGPYICAEWDLGGLPSWLLRDRNMTLRTTYAGFTEAVNSYFDELVPRLVPVQFSRGGPIIAVQVENEYGSYAKDDQYMSFIKNALESRGICELLLTSDNREGFQSGGVNGALRTINFQKLTSGMIKHLDHLQPQRAKLVMEYWSGWFDVWGEDHHTFSAEDMVSVVREVLKQGMSINIYMFHGGTNFGFMNGAVDYGTYKPQITSYDYDAPLSEAGDYTKKYHLLRSLFSSYQMSGENLPEIPALQPKKVYEAVAINQHLPLWETLQFTEPHQSESPVNMENLPINDGSGQSYGYTLYETTIATGGTLNSRNNVRDRALVYADSLFIGVLDYKTQKLTVPNGKGDQKLRLLLENCGRVNYGKALNYQRKGLIGDIVLNNVPLKDFTHYTLDMKPAFIDRLGAVSWALDTSKPTFPGFFRGSLWVEGCPADTFVKLPDWSKGVVFVNGQNLGRYWPIGPQKTLYLPGPWLKSGTNQVIVFEEQKAGDEIHFTDLPNLGKNADVN